MCIQIEQPVLPCTTDFFHGSWLLKILRSLNLVCLCTAVPNSYCIVFAECLLLFLSFLSSSAYDVLHLISELQVSSHVESINR